MNESANLTLAMHIFVAQTTSATGDDVQIRFGYELNYDVPQPTLMILTLNVHHSRVSDLVGSDHMKTTPSVPTTAYRDGLEIGARVWSPPRGIFA